MSIFTRRPKPTATDLPPTPKPELPPRKWKPPYHIAEYIGDDDAELMALRRLANEAYRESWKFFGGLFSLDVALRELLAARALAKDAPDARLREYAYQKAIGYKQRKLDRARVYTARLERGLAKQKRQTADDQRYIDMLEAELPPDTLEAIRRQARSFRVQVTAPSADQPAEDTE